MSNHEYREYADILLKLWTENILTDGEYNRIMDKLNERMKGVDDEL